MQELKNEKKGTDEEIKEMQEIVEISNKVLKWLRSGLDDIQREKNDLMQTKLEEKKKAWMENWHDIVKDSLEDLKMAKEEIKKEIAERKEMFDKDMRMEFLRSMRARMYKDVGENQYQAFQRKLKYSDITDKLKASMKKVKEDLKERSEELKGDMKIELDDEKEEVDVFELT